MITDSELIELEKLLDEQSIDLAKGHVLNFTEYTFPKFHGSWFHQNYYRILDLFAKGKIKKLIVTVPPQHGKLLPIDTPILTTKGWKKHGDLIPGDFIFGQDGNPKMVIGNSGSYQWNVDRLTFSDGNTILASKEHLWKLKVEYDDHKGRIERVMETQDIFKRRFRRSPYIDISPALNMPEKELPIDPYLLGCWLGDGTKDIGYITTGIEDINHFAKLGNHREVKPGIYIVHIEGLSKQLRLNNLIKNKHIPIDYLLSSKEQRLALLQGLMDTDGCVDKRGNCEFCQKESKLADDTAILIRSLGFKPRSKNYDMCLNGQSVGSKTRILFNPNSTDKIFRLERKQNRLECKTAIDRNDKYKLFLRTIEPFGNVMGNCITVEGGMYLAGHDLIPTHNSQGSSIQLPSTMIGHNPDLKIATVCYSATKARKFGRKTKQLMSDRNYQKVFTARLAGMKDSNYINTAEEMEIVGHEGSLKCVGYQGGLTGDPVDVLLMDDLYKDSHEANSPIMRENVKDWYITVADTRLHNDSQQLIVFTRWHNEDLIGFIEANEKVIVISEWAQLETPDPTRWYKINFEAIKTGPPTEIDPRKEGEPLWPERHSLKKLLKSRALDPLSFECLYQGNPSSTVGLLYGSDWKTYEKLPPAIVRKNYTDTADTGDDYLCSIDYDVAPDGLCYVVDVRYTTEPMEVTEPLTAGGLLKNKVRFSDIESNNGGRGFARKVQEMVFGKCYINWFFQSENKESRIITNCATVKQFIVFPDDWHVRWPQFYIHVTTFKRKFSANTNDDAPDCLTGIIERKDYLIEDSVEVDYNDL